MFQFVYISTLANPSGDAEAVMPDVLTASRRNNARAGVGGVLLCRGRRFLQVLEGERDAVMDTVARIRADPRHKAIVALSQSAVTERAFAGWAMASDQDVPPEQLVPLVERLTANASRNLRAQFTGYAAL